MKHVLNSVSLPTTSTPTEGQRALAVDAAQHLAVVGFVVLGLVLGLAGWLAPSFGEALQWVSVAMLAYSMGAGLVWRGLKHHPFKRLGPANRITLCRFATVSIMAAWATAVTSLSGSSTDNTVPLSAWADWVVVGVLAVTACLDAVDGAAARRTGMSSDFGARFDMETDAAFILIMCVLVWQTGVTGPWVLAAGGMRYAFVAVSWVWPWLSGPLPPSRRRQTVCVVQVVILVLALVPVTPPFWALLLCAGSLAALALSFVIDTRHLFLRRTYH
jgi:phosphatidylglycerophosphate synthase